MRCELERLAALLIAGAAGASLFLPGCGGGGGGGGGASDDLTDPIITLSGPPGRLSRTVAEANSDNGATPPPALAPSVTTSNHWFRLEFPFPVDRTTILENSPFTAPFSYLNGNVTVTDPTGDHIPGLAMVNGFDVFGINHAADVGFPHDVQGGVDLNLGPNVVLYVADTDRNLATIAAFGYQNGPNNSRVEITDVANHVNGTLETVRITVASVNSFEFNAIWTFTIGTATDTRAPYVVRIDSEVKDPTQPLNPNSADVGSSFIVEFSEPVVPKSIGESAELTGSPYNGNLPLPPFVAPLPNLALTATVNTAIGSLFVPFDCNPINSNNLATYRLRPLVDLPGSTSLDVLVRSLTVNTNPGNNIGTSAIDLSGNNYDGQDANLDGTPDGTDTTRTFVVGPGAALVNIPVSPEVLYWLPAAGDGIGAIDLNGRGITTNTPGANAGDRDKAVFITSDWISPVSGCEANPGGLNLTSGIAIWGSPGSDPTPTDPCTMAPMLEFGHNRYWYPVGTGGFAYGPVANLTNGEGVWRAPNDPGNPGTQFPGLNEGSSGFETICRDSNGSPILTGSSFGRVGVINDMIIGEFLDLLYFDSVNFRTSNALHMSFFNGGATARGNTIADPPTPNPPPLRYWTGMPTIGVVIDQLNPGSPPLLLEGDEVFSGFRYGKGFQQIQANENAVNAPDQTMFPHFATGPGAQSATQTFTFSSRQQIGNLLYATDASSHEVQVINSNTMRVISTISTPDPTGLAISPDMSKLYVSNTSNDSVSVIACDPFRPSFHQEIARIPVGSSPRAIAVEPDNEDIFVCNFLSNSISIIDTSSLTVRKTIDSLISGPYDIELTPRQIVPTSPSPNQPTMFGFACGIYFAYISNLNANGVLVYESGPDGPQGIGIDNIRGSLPDATQTFSLIEPRGLCASPLPNQGGLLAGGCFVTHRDEDGFGRVSHLQFTQQLIFGPLPISAPPGFFIPPGFIDRSFAVTGTWGNTDSSRLLTSRPLDVALCDLSVALYHGRPSGAPNQGAASVPPQVERTGSINSKNPIRLNSPVCFSAITPDRIYVSFEDSDSIQVLAAGTAGLVLNTIPGSGAIGIKKIVSYWRQ